MMYTNLREAYESLDSLKQTTDKDTVHSYLDVYNEKFDHLRDIATDVMEIGVMHGGSIKLWNQFFHNANIIGVDVSYSQLNETFADDGRVTLYTENAYSMDFVNKFPDNHFDFIVDDGPHSLNSQMDCIDLFYSKLKVGGIIAIEDIQDVGHLLILEQVARKYTDKIEKVDVTAVKGRYDDLMIFIYKEKE